MASHAYLYQLIARVLGDSADTWLDTPNPLWQNTPRAAIECCFGCAASVERYITELSTQAAVKRTRQGGA